jgi:hydrogenase expression/formation protein HypC
MCLAVPGKIVSVFEEEDPLELRRGKVDFGGIQKEVCLAYTPEACIGDYVLVHVGFSLSVIDEAEARQIFEMLRQMEELAETQEFSP